MLAFPPLPHRRRDFSFRCCEEFRLWTLVWGEYDFDVDCGTALKSRPSDTGLFNPYLQVSRFSSRSSPILFGVRAFAFGAFTSFSALVFGAFFYAAFYGFWEALKYLPDEPSKCLITWWLIVLPVFSLSRRFFWRMPLVQVVHCFFNQDNNILIGMKNQRIIFISFVCIRYLAVALGRFVCHINHQS